MGLINLPYNPTFRLPAVFGTPPWTPLPFRTQEPYSNLYLDPPMYLY